MAPENDQHQQEEAEDAAVGKSVRLLLDRFLSQFKLPIFLGLLITGGGWLGREMVRPGLVQASPSIADVQQLQHIGAQLDKMTKVLVEVQVSQRAILNSLPDAQRRAAQKAIANSMADLRLQQDLRNRE